MNLEEKLDLIREQVDNMTSEELQYWCDSTECFNYMNR